MQRQQDGNFLYSPSDLVTFLECSHTTFLAVSGVAPSDGDDDFTQLLQSKGFEHEKNYLRHLQAEGKHVVEIAKEGELNKRVHDSYDALRSGAEVIFQAVLRDGCWRGDADFLLKCNTPSQLGNHSYEVLDTKLTRTPEPKHIVQLCAYTELLEKLQGLRPVEMHLLTGDGKKHSFKVSDFFAYYCWAKKRCENYLQQLPKESYPQPCNYCKLCRWQKHCAVQWQHDDHLSLIANIRKSQQDKLNKAGITSVAQLATTSKDHQIASMSTTTFVQLKEQASLQTHKQITGENKYLLLAQSEGKGFSRMPSPQAGDLFFDMEGDPLYPNGLEYLFGVYYLGESQKENFKTFWAHDHEQEKKAFCQLMEFLVQHLKQHPKAFIYHYNHYETTALKRLAGRYAAYEEQLDNLLRAEKFIDLYVVVRESIRISESSYSLKNLETFYMPKRAEAVATAADSVVVYNKWRVTHDDRYLQEIADYNEQDCKSTQLLRNWLLQIAGGVSFARNTDDEAVQERKEWEIIYEEFCKCLEASFALSQKLRERLMHLLEFHRREGKAQWWRIFARRDKSNQELLEDNECLADLHQVGVPQEEKRSYLYTYHFPPQEHKLKVGEQVCNASTTESIGSIFSLCEKEQLVKIKCGKGKESLSENFAISVGKPVPSEKLRQALYRCAENLLAGEELGVAQEILEKKQPRTAFVANMDLSNKVLYAVSALDHSYLFIQGPPGTGKTQISAETIVALLQKNKKIGISANSHKVIHNLLARIENLAVQRGVSFYGVKKTSKNNPESRFKGKFIENIERTESISPDFDLFAGTAWLFTDEQFRAELDYLFIDEASQISLANVIAMASCAQSIILIGDQMQLGQPVQGVHPGDAGLSILEFLQGKSATIAATHGIFLDKTYRLKPSICKFISDVFYDNRLQADANTSTRHLDLQGVEDLPDEGIAVIPTHHDGCSQKSEVEGDIIKNIFQQLLSKTCVTDSKKRKIVTDDVLVIAPYNAQVNYLRSLLPQEARVGTIDKFQGQEALIVLISMTTSSEEYLPRNIEFLFSRNRLNVALSRAQCLAVVVTNHQLLSISCRTVEQVQLVNNFCRLMLENVVSKFATQGGT